MLDRVHFQMAVLFCCLPFCSVAAPGHPFCPVRVRHGLFARGGHSGLSEWVFKVKGEITLNAKRVSCKGSACATVSMGRKSADNTPSQMRSPLSESLSPYLFNPPLLTSSYVILDPSFHFPITKGNIPTQFWRSSDSVTDFSTFDDGLVPCWETRDIPTT